MYFHLPWVLWMHMDKSDACVKRVCMNVLTYVMEEHKVGVLIFDFFTSPYYYNLDVYADIFHLFCRRTS